MAYSKVIVNSTTIMDVTQDTVTASNLFKNITATKADGTKATGTVETVAQATPVATIANATGIISATATQSAGVVVAGTKTGTAQLTVQAGKTVTPTENTQTAVASYRWTTGTITVAAISSTYVGSGVATKSSADLILNGRTFTAPAGFYAEDATKSMTQYDLTAPSVSIANATGIITATASIPSDKIGYYTSQNASKILSLTTQTGTTITPSETAQTAVASYRWTTGTVTVAAISSTYVGSGITTRSAADITSNTGSTVYQVSIPAGYYPDGLTSNRPTATLAVPTITIANSTGIITATASTTSDYYAAQNKNNTLNLTTQAGTTITPKATSQTAVASYRWTTGTVTVAAVPTDTNNTFSANGTYTPASGKWFDSVTVSVPSGAPLLQAKTVTYSPSETTQTATVSAGSGYDGLSQVTINIQAIPTTYVGSGITERSSLSTSANTVTALAGYYPSAVTYTVPAMTVPTSTSASGSGTRKITVTPGTSTQYINLPTGYNNATAYFQINAMTNGTAGTPVATKGSVSNHQISVTPTVTNTTGYITGGTKNGTAVTVSASELVSGTLTITENGTIDVTNYASATVSVEGGGSGGSSVQIATKTVTPSSAASSIQFTGLSGNPTSFVVTSQADIATNTNGVAGVVFDGSALHGQTITSQVEADTGFTKSYSNGTLTITATSAQFQANTYKLVYTYGGSTSDIHTADIQVGSGATTITFPVNGRPAYWSCIFKSDFSTSSGYQRVIVVVNDGSSIYGLDMDSSAHDATSWSATYNGGNLTISSQGTNNGGYFHQPGYYQLTYYVDESAPQYQTKSVYATTSTQTITADNGYDALAQVNLGAISQTNLTAANIKSGTTITINNGSTNLWSVTGTYSGGGESVHVAITTWTNNTNTVTSHQFTGLSGTPKAAFLRCTSSLSRSSSSSNYFIADIRWDGSSTGGVAGNSYRRSNGNYANVTRGYSVSVSGSSITFSSSGSSTSNPGSFYNGTYELVYVY